MVVYQIDCGTPQLWRQQLVVRAGSAVAILAQLAPCVMGKLVPAACMSETYSSARGGADTYRYLQIPRR